MRRALAVLLQAAFGLSLIGPAVLSQDPDSNLPPCCRHNGKHHCAAMQGSQSSAGAALRSANCPLYPAISKVPGERVVVLPGRRQRAAADLVRCSVLCAAAPAPSSSLKRTLPERGPPAVAS